MLLVFFRYFFPLRAGYLWVEPIQKSDACREHCARLRDLFPFVVKGRRLLRHLGVKERS